MTDPIDPGGVSTADPPPPVNAGDLWHLNASPETIERMAQAWTASAQETRDAAQLVDDRAERLYAGEWAGEVADTYNEHRRKLTRDMRGGADLSDTVTGELLRAASALTAAQRNLDASLDDLSTSVSGTSTPDGMVFYPQDDQEAMYVEAAMRDAEFIRERLDEQLLDFQVAITRTMSDWTTIAAAWDAVGSGTVEPFTMPPEIAGTYMIFDGDTVVVNTGTGNDKVQITVDPASGEQIVTVNGVSHRYPPEAQITVRTGEGNDEINVPKGTKVHVTLIGGQGDDTIHTGDGASTVLGNAGKDHLYGGEEADRISGGAGRDYIDGGAGDDVLAGGYGNDTIYGMSGDDDISGGDGQDYLEGATGNDTIWGGAGNDMISGGRGDDRLFGGSGDDKVYGGFGTDAIHAGTGDDTVFGQSDDITTGAEKVVNVELTEVGNFIKVEGSPEFVERVQADLDMLRSSPRGQEMLNSFAENHTGWFPDTLTISESPTWDNGANPGSGDDAQVQYNPRKDAGRSGLDAPPVVLIYHELAHVYDYQHDTRAEGVHTGTDNPGVNNREREAVGLPIDHDHDPSTPNQLDPRHPWNLTENGLREELGAPPRTKY